MTKEQAIKLAAAAAIVFWAAYAVTTALGQGSGCIRCDCIHNPNKCK